MIFPKKVSVDQKDVDRFSGKPFWKLVENYLYNDVDILHRGLVELNKLYNKIGYSVTSMNGVASISFDFQYRSIPEGTFVPFSYEEYDRWKECLSGGIVEVFDRNLDQKTVYTHDINGVYSHVRIPYYYPVGKPERYDDVDPSRLDDYFGLIKAHVYDDNKTLLGIPSKDGVDFNRYRGHVQYKGSTDPLAA
jgi:hypothetical protein